jgi:hypothetical protein
VVWLSESRRCSKVNVPTGRVSKLACLERNLHYCLGSGPSLARPKLKRAFQLCHQSVDDGQPQAARLSPIKARRQPSAVITDLHPEPAVVPTGNYSHLPGLMRQAMLNGILAEFTDDHR